MEGLAVPMTLSDYLSHQESVLVRAFNDPAHYPVGISHPDKFPSFLQREHEIAFDPRVRNARAFTRKLPDGGVEYWTHVAYGGYRKAFRQFLEKEHGVPSSEMTCSWQADHLLSRAFARKFGVDYVRMCLLAKEQNQAYGRKFERNMVSIRQDSRSIFLLDYLCVMKALGIAIPRNREDYEARKSAIAQALSAKGVRFPDARGPEFELDGYFDWWEVL